MVEGVRVRGRTVGGGEPLESTTPAMERGGGWRDGVYPWFTADDGDKKIFGTLPGSLWDSPSDDMFTVGVSLPSSSGLLHTRSCLGRAFKVDCTITSGAPTAAPRPQSQSEVFEWRPGQI
jgi:hypothetical protein